jgi:hypothetical protein
LQPTTAPIRRQPVLILILVLALIFVLVIGFILISPETNTAPIPSGYAGKGEIVNGSKYPTEATTLLTTAKTIYGASSVAFVTVNDLKTEGHTVTINYLMPSGKPDKELMLSTLHSFKLTVTAAFKDVPTAEYLIVTGYCWLKNNPDNSQCLTFRLPRASAAGENWTTITAGQINQLAQRTVEVIPALQKAWAEIQNEK